MIDQYFILFIFCVHTAVKLVLILVQLVWEREERDSAFSVKKMDHVLKVSIFNFQTGKGRPGEGVWAESVEQHSVHDLHDVASRHLRHQLQGEFTERLWYYKPTSELSNSRAL